MVDNLQGVIQWTQSLSTLPKGVISLVVVLVAGLILYFLWQKPTEIAPEKQAPGTTIQSGNAASSGQSGGVTAGLYINQAPPVTAFPNRLDISEPRKEAMTKRARRNHSPAFKANVALAALKNEKTLADLALQFDVHVNQITRWNAQLCNGAHDGMAVARKSLEFLDLSEF